MIATACQGFPGECANKARLIGVHIRLRLYELTDIMLLGAGHDEIVVNLLQAAVDTVPLPKSETNPETDRVQRAS